MKVILDSMAVIHLAKLTVLEKTCDYFKRAMIPETVYNEVLLGKGKGFPDVPIMQDLVRQKKLSVAKIKNQQDIEKLATFNIEGGEAETVALYWQENSSLLTMIAYGKRKLH
jgi:predicted nucleic acid-binding protein